MFVLLALIAGPLDLYLGVLDLYLRSGLLFGCLDLLSWRLILYILVVEFQVFGSALRAHNCVSLEAIFFTLIPGLYFFGVLVYLGHVLFEKTFTSKSYRKLQVKLDLHGYLNNSYNYTCPIFGMFDAHAVIICVM